MCQFQHLYNGPDGYVIRCSECLHYQLSFNGTLLSVTEEEFRRFATTVSTVREHVESIPEGKEIVVRTPYLGLYMLLGSEQVTQLNHMLEAADAERSALLLLSLFQQLQC